MKIPTPEEVCKYLEYHSGDLDTEFIFQTAVDPHIRKRTEEEKEELFQQMGKFIGQVYAFTHVARNPSCINKHEDWIEEFWKLNEAL